MELSINEISELQSKLIEIKPNAVGAMLQASNEGLDSLNDMIQNGVAESQSRGDKVAETLYLLAGYGMVEALVAQDKS